MSGRNCSRRLAPYAPYATLATLWASSAAAQTASPAWGAPENAATDTATTPAPSSTAAFSTPPAPAAPAPGSPAARPHAAAAASPHRAVVRFDADGRGAVLESDTTPDGRSVPWYVVCEAPCASTVSTAGAYRVGGYGFHDSRLFRLPEGKSQFAVSAEMESSSIALPMAITIVGGVIASVGATLLLGGLAAEEQNRDGEELIVPGAIVGGVGTLVATLGVIMLIVDAEHDESRVRVAQHARGWSF